MFSPFCVSWVGPDAVFPFTAAHHPETEDRWAATSQVWDAFQKAQYGDAARLLGYRSDPYGRTPGQSILLAACLYQLGKYNAAETLLLDLPLPSDTGTLSLSRAAGLAYIALAQGRLPDAVARVESGLQTWSDHPEFTWLFGRLCLRLDEMQAAQAIPSLLVAQHAPESLIVAFDTAYDDALNVQNSARQRPTFQEKEEGSQEARRWDRDEIALYCGRVGHTWSPHSLAHGIGGSEEAVIRLSRQLSQRGWRVTVFNEPGEQAGTHDGVRYLPLEAFNPHDSFNIFVSWRTLGCFDLPLNAAFTCLWLHDVPNQEHFSRSRVARMDAIIALSRFHRACLPKLPDSLFWISANGLDVSDLLEMENACPPRDPYRCIYASSYERGLEVLLECWPDVVEQVPQASLHVFYGWEGFRKKTHEPAFQQWKSRMDALLDQSGVVHHGRVGHEVIWRETLQSGLWAYPSIYAETSCISAMKAQAAGAIPVVLSFAALEETVQYGVKMPTTLDGTPTAEHKAQYTSALVRSLTDHTWQEQTRAAMMPWARQAFSWSRIADQWDVTFRSVLVQQVDSSRAA